MSDKYAVSNKLPSTPISILAHRRKRINEEKSHHRVKQINRKLRLKTKQRNFIKPEAFIKAYLNAERDERRMKRCIVSQKVFKKPNASKKLLIAFRHRAHHIASEPTNRMLHKLRLHRLHNASFLQNTPETTAMLRLVEPYVTWGFPTVETVRDLIFKHGFLRINGKKVTINCNKTIEDNFGNAGVICVEDIVHEIFNATDNFENIQKMLLPFQLKAPKAGFKSKTGVAYAKGGEYGFRKNEINKLIQECV